MSKELPYLVAELLPHSPHPNPILIMGYIGFHP